LLIITEDVKLRDDISKSFALSYSTKTANGNDDEELCEEKVENFSKIEICSEKELIYRHQIPNPVYRGTITCQKQKTMKISRFQSTVISDEQLKRGDESKKNLINVKPFDISSMVHTKTNFTSSLTANPLSLTLKIVLSFQCDVFVEREREKKRESETHM
jgi:hypothetical protein